MKIDAAWIGRGEYLKHPIPVRTMKEIAREPQTRFLRGLAVGVVISALLWVLIVCVFLLGRG